MYRKAGHNQLIIGCLLYYENAPVNALIGNLLKIKGQCAAWFTRSKVALSSPERRGEEFGRAQRSHYQSRRLHWRARSKPEPWRPTAWVWQVSQQYRQAALLCKARRYIRAGSRKALNPPGSRQYAIQVARP